MAKGKEDLPEALFFSHIKSKTHFLFFFPIHSGHEQGCLPSFCQARPVKHKVKKKRACPSFRNLNHLKAQRSNNKGPSFSTSLAINHIVKQIWVWKAKVQHNHDNRICQNIHNWSLICISLVIKHVQKGSFLSCTCYYIVLAYLSILSCCNAQIPLSWC